MSSITDDLKQARGDSTIPRGAFWKALAALRDKDEEGYQEYAYAIFDPRYKPTELQRILVEHTDIWFDHPRIGEIRKRYDSPDQLPV